MSPPFGFLKNLTNHQPKAPTQTAPGAGPTASYFDNKSSKLVKRKSRSKKGSNDHLLLHAHQLVDSFNEVIGPASQFDDIAPSRYPIHPFTGMNKAVSHGSSPSNAGRTSYWPHVHEHGTAGFNPGLEGYSSTIPRSGPSQFSARSNRNHEPSGDLPRPAPYQAERRQHMPNIDSSFDPPDETPLVSEYMPVGYDNHSQIPHEEPPAPSWPWTPVPSVHREPSRTEELYSPEREGGADQSWLESGNLGNRFSADVTTNPRISTMADLGEPDTRSIRTQSPKPTVIPRKMSEHWVVPPVQVDEIQTRKPTPPQTVHMLQHPVQREANEPVMLQQEYWNDDDSDPEIYHYIVPAGLKVTFQDQEGNMITKISKTGQIEGTSRSFKCAPIVVHDEFGKELYRSKHVRGPIPTPREFQQGHFRVHTRGQSYQGADLQDDAIDYGGNSAHRSSPWASYSTISSKSTKTIMVDEKGNQIPVKSSIRRDGGRRLEQSFHDISYHARISNI